LLTLTVISTEIPTTAADWSKTIYNAISSVVRFENKNFSSTYKTL
jgi:hypothetical protein